LKDSKVNKKNKFQYFVASNDLKNIQKMLNDNVNDYEFYNYSIKYVSQNGYIDVLKILLKNKKINPAVDDNYPLVIASKFGHSQIIELLINDPRINPAFPNNNAINNAYHIRNNFIINIIWQDFRVKNTLKYDNPILYEILIKIDIENKLKKF
jgi:hypothetical protein